MCVLCVVHAGMWPRTSIVGGLYLCELCLYPSFSCTHSLCVSDGDSLEMSVVLAQHIPSAVFVVCVCVYVGVYAMGVPG